jgi:FtsP/CotA-like multicopper oxidase with cupredoxin domain
MKLKPITHALALALLGLAAASGTALAANGYYVQCPGDRNNDADLNGPGEIPGDKNLNGEIDGDENPNVACAHVAGTDGYVNLGGQDIYIFGFTNVTGTDLNQANATTTKFGYANFPGPTLVMQEGQDFYLTLSNLGFVARPDLFDAHTVHFHGFPNASTIFDGEPEAGVGINQGASITYYYKPMDPGTYMYHCHVEATEHMQMGMLSNLYVKPKQNLMTAEEASAKGYTWHTPGNKYVYNDGDGSTRYDVEFPVQVGGFDKVFHEEHIGVQPLPFYNMRDTLPVINGRGYPQTLAADDTTTQPMSSLITATAGQKLLLRVSNLNVTRFHTLTIAGLTMKVVGHGAKLLRAPGGQNLYYDTSTITLGGGESYDVLIDTTGKPAGEYVVYTSNLEHLDNANAADGGIMTKIVIN